MNGADFGTSELIYSENIIINGFHFPYPLNGSNNIQNIGKYPHNLSLVQIIKNTDMCWVFGFIWKKSR